jgi:H+/Cl- antiporter ClcA
MSHRKVMCAVRRGHSMGETDTGTTRVVDAGGSRPDRAGIVSMVLALVPLSLVLGALVGLGTITLLRGSEAIQSLLWETIPDRLDIVWYPVLVCSVGGLLVGLWTRRCGHTLDQLDAVISRVREHGGYCLPSVSQALVLFLLPLAFGGAVGPEAGIAGFLAAGLTWTATTLRRAGVDMVRLDVLDVATATGTALRAPFARGLEDGIDYSSYAYSKVAKAILYSVEGLGAACGIALFLVVFGGGSGLPRFPGPSLPTGEIVGSIPWALLLALVGCVLAALALFSRNVFERIRRASSAHPVARAVLTGCALGCVAMALPDVLLSGQASSRALVATWGTSASVALLVAGVAKVVMTQACIEGDWVGGAFFPMIFSGAAVGYSLALLVGLDPALGVVVVTSALVSGVTGKPLLTVAVLALCLQPACLPLALVVAYASSWLRGRLVEA